LEKVKLRPKEQVKLIEEERRKNGGFRNFPDWFDLEGFIKYAIDEKTKNYLTMSSWGDPYSYIYGASA